MPPFLSKALLLGIGTLAIHAVVFFWIPLPPSWIEGIHAKGLFPALRYALGAPLSLLPFSFSELLILLLVLLLALALGRLALGKSASPFFSLFLWTILVLGHLYFLGFGWLYRRPPLMARIGLPSIRITQKNLRKEALEWAQQAKRLRCNPPPPSEIPDLSLQAVRRVLPLLRSLPLPPTRLKAVIPEGLLLRFGVSGIFSPFTQEAHFDPGLDPLDLAFVTAHECGHLAGFAPENHASFVAWLALDQSPHPFLRYASAVSALAHLETYLPYGDLQKIRETAGPEVLADRKRARERFASFRWNLGAKVSGIVYDRFLKAQGVSEGVRSYNAFVLLVLAWKEKTAASKKPPR
jgi:hypothetical protein